MALFSRRLLQMMLDDLGLCLTPAKASDLHARLEHVDTQPALAAEIELAILWGVKQVAHLVVEPELPRARPDIYSTDLFASAPAVVEITAISDDTFSGQKDMDRAANIIVNYVDRVRKGVSANLHFEFLEVSGYAAGRYYRHRRVRHDFILTPELKQMLCSWVRSPGWPEPDHTRLTDEQIDVIIRRKPFVHPECRTFSSMPPIAYDVEDNHLFKTLRKKERQISAAPDGTLKCILVGDVGCQMLRHLRPMGVTQVSGDRVIRHFLTRSSVDIVCVVSPQRSAMAVHPTLSSLSWTMSVYDRRTAAPEHECDSLRTLIATLPRPNLEAYQARSLHRQGALHYQARGQYLAMYITSRRSSVTMKISARLIQEVLAGRISQKMFQDIAFGKDRNLFEHWLDMGFTVQDARFEKAGPDEDDDHLVFDFGPDFAAMPLKKPSTGG